MRLICFNGLSYSDNYMLFCHFFSFTSYFLTYLNKVEQYLFLFLGKKGKGKICLWITHFTGSKKKERKTQSRLKSAFHIWEMKTNCITYLTVKKLNGMRYIIYMCTWNDTLVNQWLKVLQLETWSYYSGKRGSLGTLVPLPLPVNGVESASFRKLEWDLGDLGKFFLLNLWGRICSLGLSSVPEFSAANW